MQVQDQYDAFIVDLWGVLHDGQSPYPYALDSLKQLRDAGKTILLLSNAPRRAFKAKEVLDRLGFDESLYDYLLTSGEATYNYINDNQDLGDRFYYIGPKKDEDILDGLKQKRVVDPKEADFALITGFDHDKSVLAEKIPMLNSVLAANIPLICANPDKLVVRQNGQKMICAGIGADYFANKGGKVINFGKPRPRVYEICFKMLDGVDKSKICAIGDGLETDIKGANSQNIDSILTTCGILRHEIYDGDLLNQSKLESSFKTYNAAPTYIIEQLR